MHKHMFYSLSSKNTSKVNPGYGPIWHAGATVKVHMPVNIAWTSLRETHVTLYSYSLKLNYPVILRLQIAPPQYHRVLKIPKATLHFQFPATLIQSLQLNCLFVLTKKTGTAPPKKSSTKLSFRCLHPQKTDLLRKGRMTFLPKELSSA